MLIDLSATPAGPIPESCLYIGLFVLSSVCVCKKNYILRQIFVTRLNAYRNSYLMYIYIESRISRLWTQRKEASGKVVETA